MSLLRACEQRVAETPHLSLDRSAIVRAVQQAPPDLLRLPTWDDPGFLDERPEKVLGWLLAYNAVNYCYWPEPGQPRWWTVVDGRPVGQDDEALGIMVAFAEQIRRGNALWRGSFLRQVSEEDLASWLPPGPGAGPLPLLAERAAGLRELGEALTTHGGTMGLVDVASAPALVERLVNACPSWEDTRGSDLPFRKRAQLCTGMIIGRLQGQGVGNLDDREALTAYADYRLPQILRGLGVLHLAPALADTIAAQRELPLGCDEEIDLRASVVVAGEWLRQALEPLWPHVTMLEVDHLLWRQAVARQATLPDFHRTRTTDY